MSISRDSKLQGKPLVTGGVSEVGRGVRKKKQMLVLDEDLEQEYLFKCQ